MTKRWISSKELMQMFPLIPDDISLQDHGAFHPVKPEAAFPKANDFPPERI
jgi:hypothetical protein